MKSQKQMALLGLGGGVALASAAFAIGSQAGGGSAVADTASTTPIQTQQVHDRGPGIGGPRGAGLSDLASKLGVEESRLRTALEDLRPAAKDRDAHVADLAKILKLDEAKVQAALEKVRPAREFRRFHGPDALVAELAKDLKLDEAKVRAALEKVRPERPQPGQRPDRDAFETALAKELGVNVADLRKSLADHGPNRVKHRHGGPAPMFDDLAKELGVSTDTLEKAFETLHEQRRAEFAKQLAAKLSISPDKVEEVLKELPHPGRRGPR